MPSDSCAICIYFVRIESKWSIPKEKVADIGECHRFPPIEVGFPVVIPGAWCGEFKKAS